MIFEKEQDLTQEKEAINTYVKLNGGSYKKLSAQDIDYLIKTKTYTLMQRLRL